MGYIMEQNYYNMLNIPRDASKKQIKEALYNARSELKLAESNLLNFKNNYSDKLYRNINATDSDDLQDSRIGVSRTNNQYGGNYICKYGCKHDCNHEKHYKKKIIMFANMVANMIVIIKNKINMVVI